MYLKKAKEGVNKKIIQRQGKPHENITGGKYTRIRLV